MVSALDSTRLVSAQYALKNLRGSDDSSQDKQSSSAASILSGYGLDSSSASLLSNQALSGLLDTLSAQSDTSDESETTGDSADVTSAAFMLKLLKEQDFAGYHFRGATYDCGAKDGFILANVAFALERADIRPSVEGGFRELLAGLK